MRLVYLSPVPWASFAQRPHKFVEWFHKRHGEQVLWIEPYPTRLPRLSDMRRLLAPVEPVMTEQPDWLRVLRPMALPVEPLPGSAWVNAGLWRSVLRDIEQFAGGESELLVIGKPSVMALHLLQARRWHTVVYDAMDNFPAFYSGISRLAMARRELQLLKAADSIWASSTPLRDRWCKQFPHIQLVRNGMDASVLPAQQKPKPASAHHIWGYVGTVADWFDWDWVVALAHARPNDTVRLIGPVFSPPPVRKLPANIEMLPPCAHADALQAMGAFDVGLIPFKRTVLTDFVDPIKYYEYRAMGLPVLSSDFGEMHYHRQENGVFIAGLPNLQAQAERALRFMHGAGHDAFVAANTWDARFDSVREFR